MFCYVMADYSKITALKGAIKIMRNFMIEKRAFFGEYAVVDITNKEEGWLFLLCHKRNGQSCFEILVSESGCVSLDGIGV